MSRIGRRPFFLDMSDSEIGHVRFWMAAPETERGAPKYTSARPCSTTKLGRKHG